MKIEKLTENKIRIILNIEDLEERNLDLHTIMTKAANSQGLVLEMLHLAEKEVGFETEGHKLLIEAFSSPDGFFVFTITKYLDENEKNNDLSNTFKKKITVKRKVPIINEPNSTYAFNNFDEFCHFCNFINHNHYINIKSLAKNISLYLYKNTYYLVLSEINQEHKDLKKFYSSISEFAKLVGHSKNLDGKLKEHGKVIINKNALSIGIKFFAN